MGLVELDCLTPKDGTDILSRNVGNQVPAYAAQHHRRAKTSITQRQRPEISKVQSC